MTAAAEATPAGDPARLPRQIPYTHAAEILLTGKHVSAREALAIGLIGHVVPDGQALAKAREIAAVQAEQVRSLEESLRVARARVERGAAVRADVLSLEVRLAQAQEDAIRARNAVALAVAALNTAIGRDLVPAEGPAAPVELNSRISKGCHPAGMLVTTETAKALFAVPGSSTDAPMRR